MPMDVYVPNDVDIIHQTRVDFRKRTAQSIVHLVQYERSLPVVEVELFYNGYSYTCPNNAEVWVRWSKLDGTYVYKICQVSADRKKVYFDIDYQMSYLPGDLNPILELQIGTKMAGSSPIPISIDRNPIQDGDRESHVEDLQVEILREEVAEMHEDLDGHVNNTNNPHNVTKAQVGLGNADNTSDADKPVSTAQQAEFLKAKYHLGAFDTVDTSNADYDLITRQTGYIVLDDLAFKIFEGSGYWFFQIGFRENQKIEQDPGTNVIGKHSTYQATSSNGNGNLDNSFYWNALTLFVRTDSRNTRPTGLLQYKLATPYTEKVIKNQPLNTLDQQGSEFVRKEWEKTQNIWDEELELGDISVSTGGNVTNTNIVRSKNYIKVLPNTKYFAHSATTPFTFYFYDSNKNFISWLDVLNNSSFTTPSNAHFIRFNMQGGYGTTYNHDIMLNEGDHAYPYQPYNGAIVHEKGIENVARVDKENYFQYRQYIVGNDDTPLVLYAKHYSMANIQFVTTYNGQNTNVGNLGVKDFKPYFWSQNSNYSPTGRLLLEQDLDPINDLLAELKTLVYDNQYPAVAEIDLTYATYYALPSQISGDKIIMSAGMDMTKVKGRSYVVNQWTPDTAISWATNGLSFSKPANSHKITVSGTADSSGGAGWFETNIPAGHKVLLLFTNYKNEGNDFLLYIDDVSYQRHTVLGSSNPTTILTADKPVHIVQNFANGNTYDLETDLEVVDLTVWFGSNDAIPSDLLADPSLFTKKYWKKPLPFDTGHIEDSKPVKLISYGANLWNKDDVIVGYYDDQSRAIIPNASWRCQYIPCQPNTTYHISQARPSGTSTTVYFDKNKNFISYDEYSALGDTYTTPANCYFMLPNVAVAYSDNLMVNVGSTALSHTPYVEQKEYPIIPIDMGTVDLETLDWNYVENWHGHSLFYANLPAMKFGVNYLCATCSRYKTATYNETYDKVCLINSSYISNNSATVGIIDDDYTDATVFKNSLVGTTLTYELATQSHHALRSAGSVQDDNEKARSVQLDLGELNWVYQGSSGTWQDKPHFEADISSSGIKLPPNQNTKANATVSQYTLIDFYNLYGQYNNQPNGVIAIYNEAPVLCVKDTNYSSASDLKTALSGKKINIELATPTDQSPSFTLPENIEIQKGGTIEIEYDDGYSTPCDIDFEVAVSKVLEE